MKTYPKLILILFFGSVHLAFGQSATHEFESESLHREFQISFVPFLGTNGTNSGITWNDYSFNLWGGYSGGTNKLEMAGFFNINRQDVRYAQFAGLFNLVGGNIDGAQFAGLFNFSKGNLDGVQFAGLANTNLGSVKGFQAAGIANFTTGTVDGVQLAGVMNFSSQSVTGFQGAGVLNFTASDLKGTQVAGVTNFARDVEGAQVAGILNIGKNVKGAQVGLFNYADSISGVPVGLISFVKSGYHTLELSSDEVVPLNLAFRTGKREFYNMLFFGIRPEVADEVTWTYGYGIGTSPRLGQKTYLNIEVSSEQLNKGNVSALNLINRAYVGLDIQVGKKLAVFAGPTFNFRVYDESYSGHPDLFSYSGPQTFSERFYRHEDLARQLWWGFRAGVRLF